MTRPTENIQPAKQPRGEETRRQLLKAALDCFVEHGVSGTNTTMISKRAGLTRGAYLHHFKSRQMLIAAAIDFTQQEAMAAIEASIRQLFLDPTEGLFVQIWKKALPDTFLAGYEMMMLARFDDSLKSEWQHHSDQFREKRVEILTELFGSVVAKNEALPLLEGIADFYRGIKIMEIVRSDYETLTTIERMAPIFTSHLESMQEKLI